METSLTTQKQKDRDQNVTSTEKDVTIVRLQSEIKSLQDKLDEAKRDVSVCKVIKHIGNFIELLVWQRMQGSVSC